MWNSYILVLVDLLRISDVHEFLADLLMNLKFPYVYNELGTAERTLTLTVDCDICTVGEDISSHSVHKVVFGRTASRLVPLTI